MLGMRPDSLYTAFILSWGNGDIEIWHDDRDERLEQHHRPMLIMQKDLRSQMSGGLAPYLSGQGSDDGCGGA